MRPNRVAGSNRAGIPARGWTPTLALAGVAILALGVGGCGGRAKNAEALTRGPLVARVAQICKQAKDATNQYNNPRFRNPRSVSRYLAKVVAIANARLARFDHLRPSGDVAYWAADASDWGSFLGWATAATQAMNEIARRAAHEDHTRAAGKSTYDLFYAVDDEIGMAADNVTNAPRGVPACYS